MANADIGKAQIDHLVGLLSMLGIRSASVTEIDGRQYVHLAMADNEGVTRAQSATRLPVSTSMVVDGHKVTATRGMLGEMHVDISHVSLLETAKVAA